MMGDRPPTRLLGQGGETPSRGGRDARHFLPSEATAEPAGRRDDRSLPAGVVDRLVLVLLAVELDEQAELKPHKVDARNEATFGIFDDVLSNGIAESLHVPSELHHERLEKALRR